MRKTHKLPVGRVVVWLLVLVTCVMALFPFYWLIRSAFMTKSEIFAQPMHWVPEVWHPENFRNAFTAVPFGRYFLNSIFLVVVSVIGKLLGSSLSAFGFSRLEFKGKAFCFGLVISTMMIPWSVLLIPQFMIWTKLGLYNTYWPLVLPAFFLDAFYIFLLRQFFQTIPKSYDEAAIVEGASTFHVYAKIIVPLSKPALMTVCVFTFMYTWNDFIGPLIYLKDQSKYTVSLGLQQFISQYTTEWQLMMAAATVAVVPMIVVFFFAQRYFIEGITFSGIKG